MNTKFHTIFHPYLVTKNTYVYIAECVSTRIIKKLQAITTN